MAYNPQKAGDYWSKRIKETDNKYNAVLSFSLPPYVNSAYDEWEKTVVINNLKNNCLAGKVMDIGCGWGRVSLDLLKEGYSVCAVDVSNEALLLLRKKYDENKKGVLEIFNRDCTHLPEVHPDAALMLGVLEHLPDDVKEASIRQIHHILNSGSKAYFVLNNNYSKFLKTEERYKMKDQQQNGYFVSLMDYKKMMKFMEDVGFKINIIGSNYHHSLARHLMAEFIPEDGLPGFFKMCTKLDINSTVINDDIVDQYIVAAEKK